MLRFAFALLLFLLPVLLVTSRPTTPSPSGIKIIDGLCLPKRADRLVYRHENDTHVYIAFDVLKTGKVHVYSWDLLKGETLILWTILAYPGGLVVSICGTCGSCEFGYRTHNFLSGVFLPLTSEACEKSTCIWWLWKENCVSTGLRRPGNQCAPTTAMI